MANAWGVSWGNAWGNSWNSSGPPPTPPRPGGGGFVLSESYFRDLRKAAESRTANEEKTREQRVRERDDLRKALEVAWDGVKDTEPEVFTEAAPEIDFERKTINWTPLLRNHDAILRIVDELEAKLAAQQERIRREAERQAAILAEQKRQREDDEAVALIFLAA